jgi:ketosteroid isomerase-like protein
VGDPVTREVQLQREALFSRLTSAFVRRDYAFMTAVLRDDAVLEFPGTSRLSGTYRGIAGIERYLLATSDAVRPNGMAIAFTHRDEEMVASHEIGVFGPTSVAEMTMHIGITFDEHEKVVAVSVKPGDVDLFDRTIDSATDQAR